MTSALAKGPDAFAAASPQLQAEWRAILRGEGYGRPFSDWLLRIAHFHHVPVALPDCQWLSEVFQYVRFDCDAMARAEARERKAWFKAYQEFDRRHRGSASLFSSVREPPNPPFTCAPHDARARVVPLEPTVAHQACYRLQSPGITFHAGPAHLDDVPVVVAKVDGDIVYLEGPDAVPSATLTQRYVAVLPAELREPFSGQWSPIWLSPRGCRPRSRK